MNKGVLVEILPSGTMLLQRSFVYEDTHITHQSILVPLGLRSNKPIKRYYQATLLHTYLCELNHLQNGRIEKVYNKELMSRELLKMKTISRKEADRIYCQALKLQGKNPVAIHLLYLCLRISAVVRGIS